MASDQVIQELIDLFFQRLQPYVIDADRSDRGRHVLGGVPGRGEDEDVEVGIDQDAYRMFGVEGGGVLAEVRQKYPDSPELERVRVYTEHHPGGWGSDDPLLRIDLDPIDGSDEYLRRIRNSVYSAVSIRDATTRSPMAAGMLDIYSNVAYLGRPGAGATTRFLDTWQELDALPLPHTSMSQDGVVIAAYFGRARYLLPWVEAFRDAASRPEHAGITWHGKGGSFVYALIAAGVFSAYAMPNEPVSEVLPGLAFAEMAGFPVLVREDDGSWVPFDIRNHGLLDRVPFLVAACTDQLASEIAASIDG